VSSGVAADERGAGALQDPVNYAGMVGQNIMDGMIKTCTWDELPTLLQRPDHVLLDVRTPKERGNNGNIQACALNIEVDALRERMHELPKETTLVVHCCSGQRSYYACCMLNDKGFQTINLCGGYQLWKVLGAKRYTLEATVVAR